MLLIARASTRYEAARPGAATLPQRRRALRRSCRLVRSSDQRCRRLITSKMKNEATSTAARFG